MEIRVSTESLESYIGDAVVVSVNEGASLEGAAARADRLLGGLLAELVKSGEIRGKADELTLVHTQGRLPAARVAVVGLGKSAGNDSFTVRRAMGMAARRLRNIGCRRVGTTLHEVAPGGPRGERGVRAAVEGTYVGLYRGAERKGKQEHPEELEELCLLGIRKEYLGFSEAAVRAAQVVGQATNYARRLCNLPANDMTPTRLAEEAAKMAEGAGLDCRVMGPEEIEELGMGAFLAVAQGSDEPPRLIVLTRGEKGPRPRVALVGKGITFDSGGISLKRADDMHMMKRDMAGAAAVLGAMRAIAEMNLDCDVMALLPATENLPSGHSYRPGDVVKAFNGKSIEIVNTDAEGRLVLADALAYGIHLGATHLVDVATLTGACVVALGHVASGVMGNDNNLVEAVLDAADQAGERMWHLPLFPEYRKQLDSQIADLRNIGGRAAGVITAGWFLREFVGDVSWAHIDIAGTAWTEKDEPHQVEGATGAATRTLVALIERMAGGMAWPSEGE